MFQGGRWADAFMAACGDHAGEGLDVLKAIVPSISRLPGRISGSSDAGRVEKMLRNAVGSPAPTGPAAPNDVGAEYAVRFVTLLVRKGYFTRLGDALRALEQRIDAKNGVLIVYAESAQPLDEDLQEKIKAGLIKRTGVQGERRAREIRLVSKVVPELLGGYRLRIGTELLDTSLKGQLQRMAAEAFRLPQETHAVGGFRW
jgi:F-type H+-transporting ATPase subunit delta